MGLATAWLCGCVVHHYGDARLRQNSDFASITPDRFSLKPVPLDRAATLTLHVRDLPFPIYPTHLSIPITPAEAELKERLPWQSARMRIALRATNGEVFFEKEVSLAEAEQGRTPGTYHQLQLQFRPPDRRSWRGPENMPHYTSYDAIVTVIEPSKSRNHSATLYADTYVK
jgi:hypothetical protein